MTRHDIQILGRYVSSLLAVARGTDETPWAIPMGAELVVDANVVQELPAKP